VRGVYVTVSRSFGQELKLKPKPQDQEAQPAQGAPAGP
jgi:hypothetical protein